MLHMGRWEDVLFRPTTRKSALDRSPSSEVPKNDSNQLRDGSSWHTNIGDTCHQDYMYNTGIKKLTLDEREIHTPGQEVAVVHFIG